MSIDRDQLIRLALTPEPAVSAPAALADQISRSIRATPQHRPLFRRGPFDAPPASAQVLRVALLILLLAALLGLSLVILSRPPARGPLSMYHSGPDRTGLMPGPGPMGEVHVRWDVQRPGAIGFQTMPLVAGGRVLMPDDSGSVAALDAASGAVLWETDVGGPVRSSSVLVGDLVIAATHFGDVVALGVSDGEERWRTTLGGRVIASLAAVADTVFACGEDGRVHALSAATGAILWTLPTGAPITRGPAIADGVMYVGTRGGQLRAVDLATRDVLWSVDLGDGDVGTPAIAGAMLFAGRGIETAEPPTGLVALSASDGATAWSFDLPSRGQVHAGAVDDAVVYAVAGDGNVYALDRASGAVLWTHQTGARIATLAGLVDGVLYVANTEGSVRALDVATGALRWDVLVDGEPSLPAVIDGRVFLGTSLGRAVAIGGEDAP